MQAERITACRYFLGRRQDGHIEVARQRSERGRPLTQEPGTPDHDFHAESLRPAGHLLSHAAKAHQAKRASEEPAGLGVRLLVPAPGTQVGHVVRDAPIERHE